MEPKKYPFIHAINHSIAASRPGSWLYARTLQQTDWLFSLLTGGRTTMSGLLAGLPVVWVTAIGAKSGRSRTIPLVYISHESDPNAFSLIASNFGQRHHPGWYYNLKANPQVTCRLKGCIGKYIAREASGEEYDHIWERAGSVYRGYPLYKQRASHRTIPIMTLTPVTE